MSRFKEWITKNITGTAGEQDFVTDIPSSTPILEADNLSTETISMPEMPESIELDDTLASYSEKSAFAFMQGFFINATVESLKRALNPPPKPPTR